MKYLKLFENFNNRQNNGDILPIEESVIYYSPQFKYIIKRVNNIDKTGISDKLLSIEGRDVGGDITLVDTNYKNPQKITYTTMRSALKEVDDVIPDIDLERWEESERNYIINNIDMMSDDLFKSSRNELKMGKFINTILPNKFSNLEITNFLDIYKSVIEDSIEKIKIWSGGDIVKGYDTDLYSIDSGELGNSCMGDEPKDTFEIYTTNKNCQMVALLDEDEKILSRALLWKISKINGNSVDDKYLLDRTYGVREYHSQKIKNWAISMGYYYNDRLNDDEISPNSETLQKYGIRLGNTLIPPNTNISVEIENWNFSRYPYLDTIFYLKTNSDGKSAYLSNIEPHTSYQNNDDILLKLRRTGGKVEILNLGKWIRTEITYKFELRENSVYSNFFGGYFLKDEVTEFKSGRNRWDNFPTQYLDEYCVRCAYTGEYIIKRKSVETSIKHPAQKPGELIGYILLDEAIFVITDIREDGRVFNNNKVVVHMDYIGEILGDLVYSSADIEMNDYYKTMDKNNILDIDDMYFLKSLFTKDIWGAPLPIKMAIEVYKSRDKNSKYEYYHKGCAELAGVEIDETKPLNMFYGEYLESREESLDEMCDEMKNLFKKIENLKIF
jgi:hypothetical protein